MKDGLLKDYRSMSGQAEDMHSYEAYKALIENIRKMPYGELYDKMSDCEIILEVLIRQEAIGDNPGLRVLTERIMQLGKLYLEVDDGKDKPECDYTYEWIEKNEWLNSD